MKAFFRALTSAPGTTRKEFGVAPKPSAIGVQETGLHGCSVSIACLGLTLSGPRQHASAT